MGLEKASSSVSYSVSLTSSTVSSFSLVLIEAFPSNCNMFCSVLLQVLDGFSTVITLLAFVDFT